MQRQEGRVRWIVNADDFGLTEGVNRAVAELAAGRALTSATLMADGKAFEDAVRISAAEPNFGVGCHVVLVDGKPCAPPSEVPSLLGRGKRLRDSLPRFVAELQAGRISEHEIEAEACAQIGRLQAAGLRVTHLDTHKHTHLFPRVARPLLRAAMRSGIPAIRNPFEQTWSSRLTRGAVLRKLEIAILRNFQRSFHQLLRASGLRSPDGSIGVSATGKLDAASLQQLLDQAPPGTWELVCHPGYNDASLDSIKTRLRGTRDVERQALFSLLPSAARSGRVTLVGFDELKAETTFY